MNAIVRLSRTGFPARRKAAAFAFSIAFVLLPGAFGGRPAGPAGAGASPAPPPCRESTRFPGGASPDWWASAQENLREREYEISWADRTCLPDLPAAYQAPNRPHGLRTYFTESGIRVVPRESAGPAWEWSLRLLALDRGDGSEPVGRAGLTVVGNRADYARGPVAEWYVNGERGLEQGFTIPAPPEPKLSAVSSELGSRSPELGTRNPSPTQSSVPSPQSFLFLDLSLAGTLHPRFSEDGLSVDFYPPGSSVGVLHYAGLKVADASGRDLPARFQGCSLPLTPHSSLLTSPCIRIAIDDAGASYPITVESLATSPSWTYYSVNPGIRCVAPAGDVNGDGYGDVLVGQPSDDTGGENAGAVHLFPGSPSGLGAAPAWSYYGDEEEGNLGWSVGTAGDVNGDGYSDVIVGWPEYTALSYREGGALVFFGSASGLPSTPSWGAESDDPNSSFGHCVATAGDADGDGYSDVIVGAPLYDLGGLTNEGKVFVWLGSATGLGPNGTPANADWVAQGSTAGHPFEPETGFGCSVATAGDVNGDGKSDVAVGFAFVNSAYVWYGSSTGLGPPGTPANADWSQSGAAGTDFGFSVATAGDVNGDGYSELLVGEPYFTGGEINEGRASLYGGSGSGLSTTASWTKEGGQVDTRLGWSVATAGDVDGDGYADAVVGAPYYDSVMSDVGRAYVYSGSTVGLGASASWTQDGVAEGSRYGYGVATAGDVNGDGYSDLLVDADSAIFTYGHAYGYHGSASGLASASAWRGEGDQDGAHNGWSVASAGDVNGDGFGDVVVGAPDYDGGYADEGRAFVYYGTETGLPVAADWHAECGQGEAYLGWCVSTARDVNGDGFSDLLVAAPGYDLGALNEGVLFLWLGSPAGLGPTGTLSNADWIARSAQVGGRLGISAAWAGDVNGDGYADVIAGAPYYDDLFQDAGLALVWLGSSAGMGSTGLPGNAAWMAKGNQASAHFGWSVSTAGDLDGDAYGDVVVGAPDYNAGLPNSGAAFAWYGSAGGLGPVGTPANAGWACGGAQINAAFGCCVAWAGDVNGDGFSDLAVGAWGYNNGSANEGRAAVFQGSPSGPGASPSWTAFGGQTSAFLGFSVASAGDVNGDGYSDLAVGAPGYDGAVLNGGRAMVYQGSAAGLGTTASWTGEGDQEDCGFGRCVASAGDVNGNGYADLLVAAPGESRGQAGEGAVFFYYGNGGPGRTILPRQLARSLIGGPLDLGGRSDDPTQFRIAARLFGLLGRCDAKLEWEVKPQGAVFDGSLLQRNMAWIVADPPYATLDGVASWLVSNRAVHWRARALYRITLSPFQQRGRWFAIPWAGWNEGDLRLWLDTDSDGWNDAVDCAPADPAAWQIPGEARGLMVQEGGDPNLLWAAPYAHEWGGTVVLYDVLRSASASDFLTPTCVVKDGTGYVGYDPAEPSAGQVFYYLVRSKNVCGGNLGEDSAGNPRVGGACP